jgi:hypothetical protein
VTGTGRELGTAGGGREEQRAGHDRDSRRSEDLAGAPPGAWLQAQRQGRQPEISSGPRPLHTVTVDLITDTDAEMRIAMARQ